MRSNLLWSLVFIILAASGVAIWMFMGEPVPSEGTATTTPGQTTSTDTGGPLTPAQLEARVVVDAPKSGATVPQTFSVTGKAPGPWYFEASFPIEVRDASGTVRTTGIATALTDWMTSEDVAFKADITVVGYSGPATLVLKRDNPSGMPENDASVSVPITIQ